MPAKNRKNCFLVIHLAKTRNFLRPKIGHQHQKCTILVRIAIAIAKLDFAL